MVAIRDAEESSSLCLFPRLNHQFWHVLLQLGCEEIRAIEEDSPVSDPSLWKDGCFLHWRGEDLAGRSVRKIQTLAMDTLNCNVELVQGAVSCGQQSRVQGRGLGECAPLGIIWI